MSELALKLIKEAKEKLIKLRTKGRDIPVRCYESGEEVSTQNLLEGVYDKSEIRDMENHGRY